MTDLEKARELAHDYFRRGQLGLCSLDTESAGYECAIKMAEWKEQQMIEKAVNWLNNNIGAYLDYEAPKYGCSVEIDKISLIEDFKKAMEEQQ